MERQRYKQMEGSADRWRDIHADGRMCRQMERQTYMQMDGCADRWRDRQNTTDDNLYEITYLCSINTFNGSTHAVMEPEKRGEHDSLQMNFFPPLVIITSCLKL